MPGFIGQVVHIPQTPEQQMARAFERPIEKWIGPIRYSNVPGQERDVGEFKLREALTRVERELETLGSRKGARADSARSHLSALRDSLRAPLVVFESLGVSREKSAGTVGNLTFRGPVALEHMRKQTKAREAVSAAEAVFEAADPDDVKSARDALDRAEAMQRKANRELSGLVDACRFPALPDLRAFDTAESLTSQLANLVTRGKPATALHMALDQGAGASPEVAAAFIVYEPESDHDAWKLRWVRFREESGARSTAKLGRIELPEADAPADVDARAAGIE
jgi:hypothetical protein